MAYATPRIKLRADVIKISKSHFTSIAAAILTVFTLINFRAMSMTSCCDPANNPGACDKNKQGNPLVDAASLRLASSPQQQLSSAASSASSGTLESTLLYLFDSIHPPHWNDSDFGEQYLNMKSVVNAYHRSEYIDHEDITLVTHGSIEKFAQLLDQVSQWQGPISFVMYLNNKADIKQFCSHMRTKATPDFFKYVSIHVLLEKHGGTLPYPNNILRTLAQRSIESNYFLLMDVDFIPSPGAYAYLKNSLENDYFWNRLRNNTVFVLPAFERFSKDDDSVATLDMVPNTKRQLQMSMNRGEAATFHAYFPPGHYPTNYTKWFEPNLENEFSYPVEYMKRFEPYVVAYKRGIPDFWDGFRGFGFNAATWFWELDIAGYSFEVVRDHYLVHLNHPGRKGRNITDGSLPKLQLRRFMRYISRKYQVDQKELRYWKGRKYGNGTQVSLVCETCK
mmetsp:Transcript_21964/g.36345  ORF Transcript_21964/g.36345 Transcript_21964/m.36345 type:complete len:450 (+) Transcript_21964:68-1417(+)